MVRNAPVHQPHCDGLGRLGEQVQVDLRVGRRRATRDRADQTRFEVSEQPHRLQRRAAQPRKRRTVRARAEQAMVLRERGLDLRIARQHGRIGGTEAFRRLALREQVVIDPLLGHDPRGLLRECATQVFGARIVATVHRTVSVADSMRAGGVRTANPRRRRPRLRPARGRATRRCSHRPAARCRRGNSRRSPHCRQPAQARRFPAKSAS